MASANPTTNLTRRAWSWVARVDRVVIPFLLTVEGEFVVKNLVLIAAALVVGTTVRRDKAASRTAR